MGNNLTRTLQKIEHAGMDPISGAVRRGLEKESLRIDAAGVISQHTHPEALGAALSHRYITTDYSEALLEFITPIFDKVPALLEFLSRLHQFTYQNIGQEKLWVNSMPCMAKIASRLPVMVIPMRVA